MGVCFMKRAIIIVIDSLGIGAMDDYAEFNDVKTCNTICNVANAVNGLKMPNFEHFGLGNLATIKGIDKIENPIASYGIMKEKKFSFSCSQLTIVLQFQL